VSDIIKPEAWEHYAYWDSGWLIFEEFHAHTDFVWDVDIILGVSDVRILTHDDTHFGLDSGSSWTFQVHHDASSHIVYVTENQANPGGTLTVLVPHSWVGYINIHTHGDVYISDDLPSDIILNQEL